MGTLLRLVAVVGLLSVSACVSIAGGPGGISPSQFEFVPVVSHDGEDSGGWKAARLIINLLRFPDEPDFVSCHLSVQVPEINRNGPVTDGFAQRMAAQAADAAAARVAGQGYLSAELCLRFKVEMLRELELLIPGSRIEQLLP
ncbi:hypothetical protein JQX13_06980 [Archangium violaceum]|uniref:hypothetical protein n=1 Tax=Archangium violaceum TaxID=83451 RepID=UPI00193B1F18|nr:hypothetical protein [Archangium violaceum]QRK09846.1 hypothetical protein JQX13_06980 [Archangium violaceum]